MTVNVVIDLPDELLQEFVQHMRDFDTKHDPNHEDIVRLSIGVIGSEMTAARVEQAMRNVQPPFSIVANVPLEDERK